MPVFKDGDKGTWYVMARYVDWRGTRKPKCKRGFATKRDAQNWERTFLQQNASDMNMTFEAFAELYTRDMKLFLSVATRTRRNRLSTLRRFLLITARSSTT